MSKETQITRPTIFSECKTCPIAEKIINHWLHFEPLVPYVSKETKSVTIECQEKGGSVLLLDKSVVKVRFQEGKKSITIEGGNIHPEPVACPHFKNLMNKKSAPKPEPE